MENEDDKEKKEEDNNGEDEEKKESEEDAISETSDTLNDGEKQEIDSPEETAKDEEDKEEKGITDEVTKKTSEESKQLKKVFVVIGILTVFFIGVFLFINSVRQFTYEGVDFNVIKEGELILYQTSLPVNSEKVFATNAIIGDYNFYLRNDPRKLKNLPFEGDLTLMKDLVINFTGNFKCGGEGIIAVANLMNVLEVLDVNAVKDETAGCDPDGRYTFLQLQPGDETSIEQFGPSCYNLNINNCEVLEVTEKYIVGLLSEINKNRL